MRVLVTGGNGLIASYLVPFLKQKGCFVRLATRQNHLKSDFNADEIVSINHPNLCHQIDCVLHLAANVHTKTGLVSRKTYKSANYDLTKQLAKKAIDAKVKRFILMSTIKVNGEHTQPGHPFRSSDPINTPKNNYAWSKYRSECILRACFKNRTTQDYLIIRLPLVYMPNAKGNLAKIRWLLEKKIPLPFAWVKNRRSIVLIETVNQFLWHCMRLKKPLNYTTLLSEKNPFSLPQIIQKVADDMKIQAKLIPFPFGILKIFLHLITPQLAYRLLSHLEIETKKDFQFLNWKD